MKSILLLLPCILLTSCLLPIPFPQTEPLPAYTGTITTQAARGDTVRIKGHPATTAPVAKDGTFTTRPTMDSFIGLDARYTSRTYKLQSLRNGTILKTWPVTRPPVYFDTKEQTKPQSLGNLR